MVLLGGPTAAWLLYRFVVQPRSSRYRGADPSSMWICASCRSVNDLRLARCYRCDAPQQDVEVIDPHPAGPVRLTPVGPGLDLGGASVVGGPRPITQIGLAPDVWAVEEDDWGAEVEDDQAGPLRGGRDDRGRCGAWWSGRRARTRDAGRTAATTAGRATPSRGGRRSDDRS